VQGTRLEFVAGALNGAETVARKTLEHSLLNRSVRVCREALLPVYGLAERRSRFDASNGSGYKVDSHRADAFEIGWAAVSGGGRLRDA